MAFGIEYFFYSIFKGNLEVTVAEGDKSITITQSNLGDMIAFFEKYCAEHMKDDVTFQYTAPVYWKLLCFSLNFTVSPNCSKKQSVKK